jgi:hypothetical protein
LNSALGQPTTGSDTFGKVLCHIRGGDLWEPRIRKSGYVLHGNYAALPISYYKQISRSSGKELFFLIEKRTPSWYVRMISKHFGKKAISFTGSVADDFQILRGASELALSVSTFSWMAGFTGHAKLVHFPNFGIFSDKERPDLDLTGVSKNRHKYGFEPHIWSGNKKDKQWLLNSESSALIK